MQAYSILPTWQQAVDACVVDLLTPMSDLITMPVSPIKGAGAGKPSSYGGRFVYGMIYRVASRGQCRSAERYMPGEITAQVLFVAPATRPASNPSQSGVANVEEITYDAYASWIDRLWERGEVSGRACEGVDFGPTTSGSEDEFGRAVFTDENRNVLWATSAEVVVRL